MHESMWLHPATQANARTLKAFGYRLIGPEKGPLGRAGDAGVGRMSEPPVIVEHVLRAR
jgi:phosphopantothenoylcysteine decarboxylase/phosphopantothenate--cysteine ligase